MSNAREELLNSVATEEWSDEQLEYLMDRIAADAVAAERAAIIAIIENKLDPIIAYFPSEIANLIAESYV